MLWASNGEQGGFVWFVVTWMLHRVASFDILTVFAANTMFSAHKVTLQQASLENQGEDVA